MKINNIFSLRNRQTAMFRQIVFEWEDILSKELKVDFCSNKYLGIISKYFPFLDVFLRRYYGGVFEFKMNAWQPNSWYSPNYIPCIIDFYLKKEDIPSFEQKYSKSKLVLISSLEAYNFLKENGCKLNIRHWPLSLSDKYKILPYDSYHKEYDLVLIGHQNPILLTYLNRYLEKHPDFRYIKGAQENGKFVYRYNNGNFVCYADTREQFILLMQKSKCVLYTTPGIDNVSTYANGFNQITPRFLEYIACGCHIIARYKNNVESEYFEIDKFCPCCNSFEEFEASLEYAINNRPDLNKYQNYLSKHYTSIRAKQLKDFIEII